MRKLPLLLFFAVTVVAAEPKKDELPPLPTDVTLTSGAVIRKITVVRWEKDSVVVKHVGGVDPIRYISLPPATRALFEKHREVGVNSQKQAASAAAKDAERKQTEYTKKIVDEARFLELARTKKIAVGMPQHLVRESWGDPIRINRSSGGADQWVYGSGQYVYIEENKVRSWQVAE